MDSDRTVLVVNSGSSSIKFALFDLTLIEPRRIWNGVVNRIGSGAGQFIAKDVHGALIVSETMHIHNHGEALDLLLGWIDLRSDINMIDAIVHRVVHGGLNCDCALVATQEIEETLQKLIPLAPLHLPHNLAGIAAVRERLPELQQIVCFDTAFHAGLPRVARLTGLPSRYEKEGIVRYGFHGLSYEFIIDNVRRRDGDAAANGRIIVAHLGNGASMVAIKSGQSIETSMGFSTISGLPMGTRTGDLDPGILLYLLTEKNMSAEKVQDLLYKQSGLLGISGLSRNMVDLLAQQDQPQVADAIDYFCHHARRHLAGLTASLGGLDRLIFTGGIGANSPEIRTRICTGLDYLGIGLHSERNAANECVLSEDDNSVLVEAVATDEELVMARHARDILVAVEPQRVRVNG